MKSFGSFIKEAVETSASRQAKLMNLIGDGHGDWYDKEGNLTVSIYDFVDMMPEGAKKELKIVYEDTSSNRSLMLKVFFILLIFIVFYILVVI